MKRSQVGWLLVVVAVMISGPAAARENPIAKVMGNLRWGMDDLALKSALKGKLKGVSPVVEFTGQSTRWDSSPVGEEYTHGNEEAMFVSKDGTSENYFFFIGGQLWKWVKLYPAAAFGGHDFERFASKIEKRFGKGFDKQGEVNPGSGLSYHFVEYMDRNTRLRAVDKTKQYGQYALVFEAMDTVRSLSALRTNTIRRGGPKASSVLASARSVRRTDDDDDNEYAAAPARSSARPAPFPSSSASASGNAKNRRSLFADEQQQTDETNSEYQARKQRVLADQREQQRRLHERGEEAKKGKTLDELAGIDDDDPLGGMR